MRLSWNEIRIRAAQFAQDWKDAGYEKGETQSFYNEFFDIFDVKRRTVARYEEHVQRLDNSRGFIDLFWPGVLLVEQKSAGVNLAAARKQAGTYFDALPERDRPRYQLLCDFQTFELLDRDEREEVSFALAELPQHVEKFGFILGVQKRTFRDQDPVNIEASERVGQLHDALETDWNDLLPSGECSYVLGNPPFVGAKFQSPAQREQVRHIAALGKSGGTLDYVAAWFIKAGEYVQQSTTQIGFVATNSITQGEQVAQLWPILFDRYKLDIAFAHRTFAWGSDARGMAHVHVVIIGLTKQDDAPREKRLFSYDHLKGEPHESRHAALSPYLFDASGLANPRIVIKSEHRPINGFRRLKTGVQMIDNGILTFNEEEKEAFINSEPMASKFFRPLVGVDERLNADYLVIPNTSSERRTYVPIGWLSTDVIANQKLRILPEATLCDFALLTSAMHMAWMRMVTGRMKSDYMYSVGVVYNTFPLPSVPVERLQRLAPYADAVLAARAAHPNATLADLYDPDLMPVNLRKAHQALDRAVDRLYRRSPFPSDRERVEHLLVLYEKMIAPLSAPKPKRRRRRS